MARGGLPVAPNSNPRLPRAIAYCRPKMVLTMGPTLDYLISQSREAGLRPGNPDGSFTQTVPLWATRSSGTMQVRINDHDFPLAAGVDYAASSTFPVPEVKVSGSQLVFVGYGVIAPEYHWDDYKGVDVKGKTVVLLSGDPPVPDQNDPTKL